jgi:hypothetical protein
MLLAFIFMPVLLNLEVTFFQNAYVHFIINNNIINASFLHFGYNQILVLRGLNIFHGKYLLCNIVLCNIYK